MIYLLVFAIATAAALHVRNWGTGLFRVPAIALLVAIGLGALAAGLTRFVLKQ
jgi:hypothetical protein